MEFIDTKVLINIAHRAGDIILDIYSNHEFEIEQKKDSTPVTIADRKANEYICSELKKYYPDVNIISEESKQVDYLQRRTWPEYFIVDPLDGTKEFIKKNGEFTVNIAYAQKGKPLEGVVYAPFLVKTYFTKNGKSFVESEGREKQLPLDDIEKTSYTIVSSRSHLSDATQEFVDEKKKDYPDLVLRSIGSSLKFCLIAEGSADVYPRLGPTMEWDTAAAQAIVEQAGKSVLNLETLRPLKYNKESLLNPHFIVE